MGQADILHDKMVKKCFNPQNACLKFHILENYSYLCTAFQKKAGTLYGSFYGEMVEWSITTVLKTVVPRGTGGSNPPLSANRLQKDFTRVVNLAFKN